jgi:hypothetical protein
MNTARLTILRRVTVGAILFAVFALASGFSGCPGYKTPGGGSIFGQVVPNPNMLTIDDAHLMPTFSVSQTYYSGSFSATSNKATVASPAPTSPPDTFVVSGCSNLTGGTATITVTGGGGMTGTVAVTNNHLCNCVRHHDMWQSSRH